MKTPALQNEKVRVLPMPFRPRKGFATFEKRAPGRVYVPFGLVDKKISGNSGRFVNGTRLFVSFHWKFFGERGISQEFIPIFHWKLSDGNCVLHLSIFPLVFPTGNCLFFFVNGERPWSWR